MMNYKSMLLGLMATVAVFQSQPAQACTGITLTAKDSTRILARTIEWGGRDLNSCYVVVPRGYTVQSYVPGGQDGMKFTAKYGYDRLRGRPGRSASSSPGSRRRAFSRNRTRTRRRSR